MSCASFCRYKPTFFKIALILTPSPETYRLCSNRHIFLQAIVIAPRCILLIVILQTWHSYNEMGLVATKPVFGISEKASFKPVSSATQTG